MNVFIASGERFHAFHLAKQLRMNNCLGKIFTMSSCEDDHKGLGITKISNFRFGIFLNYFYLKFRIYHLINNSFWYLLKDNFFDKWLSSQLEKEEEIDIFIGWANHWLNSLDVLRKKEVKIITECGSWHVIEQANILREEFYLHGIKHSPVDVKIIEKILKEYDAADYIMVPAKHVYNSFIRQNISPSKILKVPYGVDFDKFYQLRQSINSKFKVIFVGQVSLQKGVHYLIKAWEKLNLPNDLAELLIVGPIQDCFHQVMKTKYLSDSVVFYGGLSQEKLKKLYLESSVFVLPSIHDGFGMVISEAMASGLPAICTVNTGGEELIENGKEGFILPIRDVDALAEKILWCYENREACFEMGLCAQKKIKNYTWDDYGDKIMKIYGEILK